MELHYIWNYEWLKTSLMAKWFEQASQWNDMCCHDLEVMSSNTGWVKLTVRSKSVLSHTLTNNICHTKAIHYSFNLTCINDRMPNGIWMLYLRAKLSYLALSTQSHLTTCYASRHYAKLGGLSSPFSTVCNVHYKISLLALGNLLELCPKYYNHHA